MKPSAALAHPVRFDEARADQMDRTALTVFAPIYPVIAEQIVRRLDITEGRCVEIGSGPGLLSLALARITDLQMILLDVAMPICISKRSGICPQLDMRTVLCWCRETSIKCPSARGPFS